MPALRLPPIYPGHLRPLLHLKRYYLMCHRQSHLTLVLLTWPQRVCEFCRHIVSHISLSLDGDGGALLVGGSS